MPLEDSFFLRAESFGVKYLFVDKVVLLVENCKPKSNFHYPNRK